MLVSETDILVVLIAVLILWLVIRRYYRQRQRLRLLRTDWQLSITEPVPLCGTPDVVWLRGDGKLVIGDYKSRLSGRVQLSDQIQLSVYRVLLLHSQQKPVADYGFIYFRGKQRTKVKLMSEKKVIDLYKRYLAISEGNSKGKRCGQPGYCRYCSHWRRC